MKRIASTKHSDWLAQVDNVNDSEAAQINGGSLRSLPAASLPAGSTAAPPRGISLAQYQALLRK